jgi:hypothetical protein
LILGSSSGRDLPEDVGISYLFDHPWDVLWPMAIGGVILGTLAWFVSFFPMRSLVGKYQYERRKRLLAKAWRKRQKKPEARRLPAAEAAGKFETAELGPDEKAL